MTVAKVSSVAPIGFDGEIIEVECDTTNGLPAFQIVGLANKSIDEARERVKSAITNSLLEYPKKRITVNLAPAEIPKNGTHYDLAIALSILLSSGQLRSEDVTKAVFIGELALNGEIRRVSGIVGMVETAKNRGYATAYVPTDNIPQAQMIEGIEIIGAPSLKALYLHLKKESRLPAAQVNTSETSVVSPAAPLLDDVFGQEQAKRALIIAAAGRHNLLLSGSPGAGKSMLAKVLVGLLPPLSSQEQLEVTKLHSITGETIDDIVRNRPFRAPHHTASRIAMIGGGSSPLPGDISLAHLGVLYLDEIPEYPRSTLEALRQPMEDRIVTIRRAHGTARYPADFMLVATMNPCPCGYYGDTSKECTCNTNQILAYQKRLSGPMLDRIDMHVTVSRVPSNKLLSTKKMSKNQHNEALKLIQNSRNMQFQRYNCSKKSNVNLTPNEITTLANASPETLQLLSKAADKLSLSARSYFKVLKVARTIADIELSESITPAHLSEALQYRQNT